jgi:hypothetical protein
MAKTKRNKLFIYGKVLLGLIVVIFLSVLWVIFGQ